LTLAASMLLVVGLGWEVTHRAPGPQDRAASTTAPASAAKAASVTGRASIPVAPGQAGGSLINPLYTWDYRWAAANPAVGPPKVLAQSAVLVDVDNRHVLFDRLAHAPMAPASTTKLTTAMVALDHAGPDTLVTVPPEAITVEPNVMGLSAGEQLTVRELLYGLLLDSGNDAAETLAATILDGGRPAFLKAMNVTSIALGLTDTYFTNPSGLDDPQQYSSAHDLALTAAYLYAHYPVIEQVVTTKEQALSYGPGHKAFYPYNLNKLLWTYPGAIGFKTGLTDAAGDVFVGGAHRGSHTLVVVEMNDPLMFTDAAALLDYGFRRAG
jgi:serine-type D-Ala-D-Ala carboxypeptidase (penicillin-binding protein 5/6)